jgi:hypothetical protein
MILSCRRSAMRRPDFGDVLKQANDFSGVKGLLRTTEFKFQPKF